MDIQRIIKRHGFTQLQVAQAMALHTDKVVNPGSLSYSITKGNPTIGRLRQIADIIGANITEFFEDELPAQTEQAPTPTYEHTIVLDGVEYGLVKIQKQEREDAEE